MIVIPIDPEAENVFQHFTVVIGLLNQQKPVDCDAE